MNYPKFSQRYLGAFIFFLIISIGSLGALFLVYTFNGADQSFLFESNMVILSPPTTSSAYNVRINKYQFWQEEHDKQQQNIGFISDNNKDTKRKVDWLYQKESREDDPNKMLNDTIKNMTATSATKGVTESVLDSVLEHTGNLESPKFLHVFRDKGDFGDGIRNEKRGKNYSSHYDDTIYIDDSEKKSRESHGKRFNKNHYFQSIVKSRSRPAEVTVDSTRALLKSIVDTTRTRYKQKLGQTQIKRQRNKEQKSVPLTNKIENSFAIREYNLDSLYDNQYNENDDDDDGDLSDDNGSGSGSGDFHFELELELAQKKAQKENEKQIDDFSIQKKKKYLLHLRTKKRPAYTTKKYIESKGPRMNRKSEGSKSNKQKNHLKYISSSSRANSYISSNLSALLQFQNENFFNQLNEYQPTKTKRNHNDTDKVGNNWRLLSLTTEKMLYEVIAFPTSRGLNSAVDDAKVDAEKKRREPDQGTPKDQESLVKQPYILGENMVSSDIPILPKRIGTVGDYFAKTIPYSTTWNESRTRRIIGNVKKSEERSRRLLLCEEAGGGELCRMLFKGHLNN